MPGTDESLKHATDRHIAFVINNYPPKVGGVEQHVFALAKSLARLGPKVTVITLDRDHAGLEENDVTVLRLPSTRTLAGVISWPFPGTSRKLRAYLREAGVTHISTHTRFFPMSFVGVRLGRRLGLPVIHTEHGSDYVRGVSPLVGLASRLVDHTLGRYVLNHAAAVLAISSSAADFVGRLCGKPSTVFHNAIDTELFTGPAAAVAPARLVFLGRLVPGKGWERALAVAGALAPTHPELEMHFIGDGADRAALEAAVAQSPIRGRTTVHGFLPTAEISALLRGSLLLNPTTLAEGFQTTLLEAIASGGAVISTPVTAAAYLAGKTGNVVLVEDYAAEAWIDAARAMLDGGWEPAAPELIESFDWSGRSKEFHRILESL